MDVSRVDLIDYKKKEQGWGCKTAISGASRLPRVADVDPKTFEVFHVSRNQG